MSFVRRKKNAAKKENAYRESIFSVGKFRVPRSRVCSHTRAHEGRTELRMDGQARQGVGQVGSI